MLVLVMAAICKCHPRDAAKLLPRMLAYVAVRLRDKEQKITDACGILVSAIVLHVLPVSLDPMPFAAVDGDATSAMDRAFDAVAAPFLKEANVVCEAATKCLCHVLRPVEFDGVSLPASERMASHAERVERFFGRLVATITARFASAIYANYSPSFLLLQSAYQVARVRWKM